MEWIQGQVVQRHVWSPGLFTLSVKAPGVAPFEPGQFLQLGLEQPEKHLHRPYSVASPHGDILDFFIVLVEDGHLTPKLWDLREGDRVDVSSKAAGSFTLSHVPPSKVLWLIATGTGLAPYIAMIRSGEIFHDYEKVIVVHGVRFKQDLAYQKEFADYQNHHGNSFVYIPAVSRESIEGGITGRITTALANGELERIACASISPESSRFMLCGNPDMLNEMEEILLARGLLRHKVKTPGQIVVERYW